MICRKFDSGLLLLGFHVYSVVKALSKEQKLPYFSGHHSTCLLAVLVFVSLNSGHDTAAANVSSVTQ